MKRLLILTALLESGAGLALLGFPTEAAKLLLGTPLEESAALVVARVCGVGLLTLGVACWFASNDAQSRASRGIISAMVIYNLGAAAILGAYGLGSQLVSAALWAAVLLHMAMTIWCVASLVRIPDETKIKP